MKRAFLSIAIILVISLQSLGIGADDNNEVSKALEKLGYTSVELRQNLMNEFEVKGFLNGDKSITLIVNFGMAKTVFDKNKLDELKIEYFETNQVYSINDDEEDMYIATIDSLNIGNGKIKAMDIMGIDYEEYDALEYTRAGGILGRDFLMKYHAILDLSNQMLYLKTN